MKISKEIDELLKGKEGLDGAIKALKMVEIVSDEKECPICNQMLPCSEFCEEGWCLGCNADAKLER